MRKFKKIISDFCIRTGQRINNQKSVIILCNSVVNRKRKAITKLWGFKLVKEVFYLGIKLALRRLLDSDFNYILEKVNSRLNVWGKNLISLAGRIVLTKSVLAAIPIFVATHTLIPKRILHKIEKAARNFIWDKPGGLHELHYISWEKMCRPWKEGGLSIKSVSDITGPLRAKFAWNFLKEEDSLLYKSLKARYGPKFWMKSNTAYKSVTWKILADGAQSLISITRWKIAAEDNINILDDAWILDRSLQQWPTFVSTGISEIPKLKEFISGGCWNIDMLNTHFGLELVKTITQIEIDSSLPKDSIELNNKFSGKSIMARTTAYKSNDICSVDYGIWLKKLKLNPIIECFWWRLLNEAIPTNEFLMNRRLLGHNLCHRGCEEHEDTNHIMVHCHKLQQVISILNIWGFTWPLFTSAKDCKYHLEKLSVHNKSLANLYCSLVYFSWKSRNSIKHGKNEWSLNFIAGNAISYASIASSNLFLDH
ncbi:Putative ribonuclease H protein [Dendrobium catenatum]|uniref:Ribonuclease H protein n=1 Tax=Dendrobium catenatum TaxID=906689 RepID=A0A2I0XGY8_9ASPA|nr:Putative ribonuclease H protein [Dendrobium catenatum]